MVESQYLDSDPGRGSVRVYPAPVSMLFRLVALAAVTLSYLIILLLFINYDRTSGALQFVEQHWWITAGGSQYFWGSTSGIWRFWY